MRTRVDVSLANTRINKRERRWGIGNLRWDPDALCILLHFSVVTSCATQMIGNIQLNCRGTLPNPPASPFPPSGPQSGQGEKKLLLEMTNLGVSLTVGGLIPEPI